MDRESVWQGAIAFRGEVAAENSDVGWASHGPWSVVRRIPLPEDKSVKSNSISYLLLLNVTAVIDY